MNLLHSTPLENFRLLRRLLPLCPLDVAPRAVSLAADNETGDGVASGGIVASEGQYNTVDGTPTFADQGGVATSHYADGSTSVA